jgi:simple sugar transport system permease protein
MKASQNWVLPGVAALAGLAVTLFIILRLFGGDAEAGLLATITANESYANILFIIVVTGISVALFVYQLGWGALRVLLTVVAALILGYLVTAFFNLDSANRFRSGEYTVALISEAEPIEAEDLDIEYGRNRGGEFNEPNVREPETIANLRFQGAAGDIVTILAHVANRRSEVNLQVALLDASGAVLISATNSTEAQIEQFEDMRSTNDAAIQDFTLPADGIYTIQAEPEAVSFGTTLQETVTATNFAYEAFLLGPLSRVNRWAVWIQDALTLIVVGLAITIVFRARQVSLGAEGQIYFGALASGVVALAFGNLPPIIIIPLAILSAMTAGFLWGLIPGVLKAYLNANELVSSLMLNTIAIRFYEMVLNFQLKPPDAGYIASDFFNENAQLPVIVADSQVTIAVFGVIIIVILVWLLLSRTPLGYEIRMVGSNVKFADYGGVNTKRTIMLAMAVSGIVAGLAGAHLSTGIFRQLLINISAGLAFEGVVVALLARNNPLVVPFTGLLYAYLRTGAQFMERDANVSFEVVRVIQAVIILLITAEALTEFFKNRRKEREALNAAPQPPQAELTEGKGHA